jgi:hypothetical protein
MDAPLAWIGGASAGSGQATSGSRAHTVGNRRPGLRKVRMTTVRRTASTRCARLESARSAARFRVHMPGYRRHVDPFLPRFGVSSPGAINRDRGRKRPRRRRKRPGGRLARNGRQATQRKAGRPGANTKSSPGTWCRSSALISSVRALAAQAARSSTSFSSLICGCSSGLRSKRVLIDFFET